MKPITFSCTDTPPFAPEEVAAQILDLSNRTGFHGYGVLPGVGTRIRVTNTDGSGHVEEVVEWRPDRRPGS